VKQDVKELLRQIYEQREEILEAFIAKYGCGPDEVQLSPDGEKYWVWLRVREHIPCTDRWEMKND
jgi:DNA-binding transcriptional MocR family regulator